MGNDIFSGLSGKSVTCDWDVLVSYRLSRLNTVLKGMWDRGMYDKCEVDGDLDVSKKIKAKYDLSVDSPTIQFIDGGSSARLTMGLDGLAYSYRATEPFDKKTALFEVKLFRGQHKLQVDVPVVSIPSKVVESNEVEKMKQHATETHQIIFIDVAKASHSLVFHFHDIPENKWKIYSMDSAGKLAPPIEPEIAAAASSLQKWFLKTVKTVDYTIAKIHPKLGVDDQNSILQPKSFIFTSQGTGNDAVLCVWMQTSGSGYPPGHPQPKFTAADSPIANYDTSIFIRHEVFRDSYLVKSLSDAFRTPNNPNPVTVVPKGPGHGGFVFTVSVDEDNVGPSIESISNTLNNIHIRGPSKLDISISPKPSDLVWHKLRLRDYPLFLNIINTRATWSRGEVLKQGTFSHTSGQLSVYGEMTFKYSVYEDTPAFAVNQTVIDPYFFNISSSCFRIIGDFKATGCKYKVYLPTGANHVHVDVPVSGGQNNVILDPELKFHKLQPCNQTLNFFSVKNIFAAGTDIIEIDPVVGLRTPHDVFMVGKVTEKSEGRAEPGLRKPEYASLSQATQATPVPVTTFLRDCGGPGFGHGGDGEDFNFDDTSEDKLF
ncbi:hypothetical protein H072_3882 [Dactylellina haptotyla CBS 200.50]|uniref:Uncharacterized protein n=1 Tax=Dactylellina haptotyla (strain CBS 200.50) TaxID=1284197 RepID=S8ALZ5_DACHA|nr:hypothetical protein H072_3882 [Dactylellina haptotyla CBS 200.50]